MDSFRSLKITMVVCLALVAAKLLAIRAGHDIPLWLSLPVIGLVLLAGLAASLLVMSRRRAGDHTINDIAEAADEAWQPIRKAVVLVLGLTILAASIPIGFLPGPGGIAVAIAGLALLATEFLWARLLLRRAKLIAKRSAKRAQRSIKQNPRPWRIPIVAVGLTAALWLAYEHIPANFESISHRTVLTFAIGPILTFVAWTYFVLAAWIGQRQSK
jgi:hypothetical protein